MQNINCKVRNLHGQQRDKMIWGSHEGRSIWAVVAKWISCFYFKGIFAKGAVPVHWSIDVSGEREHGTLSR